MSSEEDNLSGDFGEERIFDPIGKYEGGRNEHRERHGYGRALLPNGDYYEGCYNKGKRHGKGLYVFPGGARYDGQYRYGSRCGKGTFYYPDGTKYEGEWKHNQRHGYGDYTYMNGDIYSGGWFKGKRHGKGTYFCVAFNTTFVSVWNVDQVISRSIVKYPQDVSYHGTFNQQTPYGKGLFAFPHLNCMQLGVYEHVIIEKSKNEEMSEQGEEEENEETGENEVNVKWYPSEIIEYDESRIPSLPSVTALPETPDTLSERSASYEQLNSDVMMEGAWSEDNLDLEDEEELQPSTVIAGPEDNVEKSVLSAGVNDGELAEEA